MEEKQKSKKWYQKWWVWVVAFFLFLYVNQNSDNSISPIVLIIGIIGVIFSGSLLWKILTEKNTGETVDKTKIKYTSIILW